MSTDLLSEPNDEYFGSRGVFEGDGFTNCANPQGPHDILMVLRESLLINLYFKFILFDGLPTSSTAHI